MLRRARSIHGEGVEHGALIPFGARVGNMIFSSGILGADPSTGELPEDLESQCWFAFANMRTMLENAEETLDNVGSIKVHMRDQSQRKASNRPCLEMFRDEADRPSLPRHRIRCLPSGVLVQLEVIAVVE